jgi:hypothetical protein
MAVKYSNNASTTLNGAITASATSITVNDVSDFPTLTGSDYTYLTLVSLDGSILEIIKVTAINTSTKVLTVERGQDDTTGAIFSSGDICELRLNAAMLNAAASQNDDAQGTAVAMSIALG